jgi:hypothetical protein
MFKYNGKIANFVSLNLDLRVLNTRLKCTCRRKKVPHRSYDGTAHSTDGVSSSSSLCKIYFSCSYSMGHGRKLTVMRVNFVDNILIETNVLHIWVDQHIGLTSIKIM